MVSFIYSYIYCFIDVAGDNMKNIKYLIIVLFLFIGLGNVSAFDNSVKVYDYAQLLTEKKEQELRTEVNNYINRYNIDMVIVTVKYYEQLNLTDYMNLFYAQNGFGKGINKDGIIAVIDLKENNNKFEIKRYGRANSLYSEEEIKNIINKVNNEDKYYNKLFTFINYSNKYINETNTSYNIDNGSTTYINWLLIIIPSFIISTIITIIIFFKNKKILNNKFNNYYVIENNIVINKKEDKFITTNTKKIRIKKR